MIELAETEQLQITSDGMQVTHIPVMPGETIRFVVTNTAGFDHDLYIGPDAQLAANRVAGLPGLATSSSEEPRTFDWTVPQDVTDLRFGCTLRGHYRLMNGGFSSN